MAKRGPDSNLTAYIYMYIYIIFIFLPTSRTTGGVLEVYELNIGTRRHRITGRASFRTTKIGVLVFFFPNIPISDRWVANVIDNLDPDFQHSVSFLGCVEKLRNSNYSFWSFVVSSSFLSDFRHWKYYKNRGLGHPSFSAVFFPKLPS